VSDRHRRSTLAVIFIEAQYLICQEESFGENENAGKYFMDLQCLKLVDDLSDANSKGLMSTFEFYVTNTTYIADKKDCVCICLQGVAMLLDKE